MLRSSFNYSVAPRQKEAGETGGGLSRQTLSSDSLIRQLIDIVRDHGTNIFGVTLLRGLALMVMLPERLGLESLTNDSISPIEYRFSPQMLMALSSHPDIGPAPHGWKSPAVLST